MHNPQTIAFGDYNSCIYSVGNMSLYAVIRILLLVLPLVNFQNLTKVN